MRKGVFFPSTDFFQKCKLFFYRFSFEISIVGKIYVNLFDWNLIPVLLFEDIDEKYLEIFLMLYIDDYLMIKIEIID